MKYILLLFVMLGGTLQLSAQIDSPKGGMAIPRAKKENVAPTNPSLSTTGPISIKPEKKTTNPMFQIGGEGEKKSPMSTETRFVQRGTEFEDKFELKQKRESSEPYKGNQYFGEFKSQAVFVQIMCRDFEYADGDMIKVMVNDKVIIPEIILTNEFKGLQLTLENGFNKIDFVALNQGTSGPNTAQFVVYDDNEKLVSSNQWNLATGFKATVILVKEK